MLCPFEVFSSLQKFPKYVPDRRELRPRLTRCGLKSPSNNHKKGVDDPDLCGRKIVYLIKPLGEAAPLCMYRNIFLNTDRERSFNKTRWSVSLRWSLHYKISFFHYVFSIRELYTHPTKVGIKKSTRYSGIKYTWWRPIWLKRVYVIKSLGGSSSTIMYLNLFFLCADGRESLMRPIWPVSCWHLEVMKI